MDLDGVFLDMYGTVTTGDRHAVETVCARIVRETGLEMTAQELSITWGNRFFAALDSHNDERFLTLFDIEAKTLCQTMDALGVAVEPRGYVEELSTYWRDPPLQPEVAVFLAAVPLPVCLVSNADRLDVDLALERHGICVAEVVTSEEVRSYKPATRIFEEALRRTGWRRERVIHVGDSLHSDVGGALAAGIHCAWVNRVGRIHDVGNHDPDWEIPDLLGLLPLVNGH